MLCVLKERKGAFTYQDGWLLMKVWVSEKILLRGGWEGPEAARPILVKSNFCGQKLQIGLDWSWM
jgi:hypothetical protein